MDDDRNIKHKFTLKGLKIKDTFLGCNVCWFRYNPHEAAKPICPYCQNKMRLYTVTKEDIKDLK